MKGSYIIETSDFFEEDEINLQDIIEKCISDSKSIEELTKIIEKLENNYKKISELVESNINISAKGNELLEKIEIMAFRINQLKNEQYHYFNSMINNLNQRIDHLQSQLNEYQAYRLPIIPVHG